MFIYRKIIIDNETTHLIQNELKNLDISDCIENFNYIDISRIKMHCPVLSSWMQNKNLKIFKAAIIITKNNFSNSIPHIDAQVNSLALNFPIENCEETETIFYTTQTPLETVISKKPNGVIYKSLKNKDWIEIGKYTLDSATLLNTHVPHKLVNYGNNKRVALSIRFDPDPWELIS